MPTPTEAYTKLTKMDVGEQFDFVLSNPALGVKSTKEITKVDEKTFHVWHSIDDTMMEFSFEEMVEVLSGLRDIWSGKVLPDVGKIAEEIVDIVIDDLFGDRKGLTEVWESIDEEIRESILEELREKVVNLL